MNPFIHIGRRRFLRESALGLGVAPLISGLAESEEARSGSKTAGAAPSFEIPSAAP